MSLDAYYDELVKIYWEDGKLGEAFYVKRQQFFSQLVAEKGVTVINSLYSRYAKSELFGLETKFQIPLSLELKYRGRRLGTTYSPRMAINVYKDNKWCRHYDIPEGFQLEEYLLKINPGKTLKLSFASIDNQLYFIAEVFKKTELIETHQGQFLH